MTNEEAIKIVEDMMFNMSAEGLRISRDEDEAVEKLIQTAKDFDVLTGIIVGIMAQKKDAHESACLGVYLHGLSGESASKEKGNYSVLAEDIVEHISEVLKEIPEVV